MKGRMEPYAVLLPPTLRPLFEPRPPLPFVSPPSYESGKKAAPPKLTGVASLMDEVSCLQCASSQCVHVSFARHDKLDARPMHFRRSFRVHRQCTESSVTMRMSERNAQK